MRPQFHIPSAATKFILFQRTDYATFEGTFASRVLRRVVPFINYERLVAMEARVRGFAVKKRYLDGMTEEYLSIKGALPEKCSTVLDIGCGVAGIDLFLNRHYGERTVDFFLLDRTHVEEQIFYMFRETAAFYNSLDVARRLLMKNGVDAARIHLLQATSDYAINVNTGVDLVVSLISWGFHYPVSTYLERAYSLLNDGGVMILDIREGTDGLNLINRKFGAYEVLVEKEKYRRICSVKRE